MKLHTIPCALALASTASGQLLVSTVFNSCPPNTAEYYAVDVSNGNATPLFTGWTGSANGDEGVAGMAADDANSILYFSGNPTVCNFWPKTIFTWDYDFSNQPQILLTDPMTAAGDIVDCSGLAFANGTLYALNQFGSTPDGIYSIDLSTGVATLELAITGLDVGGLAYNASDGLFYGTSDPAGIYAFDLVGQTQTFVTAYPAVNDVDGCAVDPSGAGIVYLIEDNASQLHAYDLGTGTYVTMLTSPIQSTYTYSGGAWAPGLYDTSLGTNFECAATVPNSTGLPGVLAATGSDVAASNDVTLTASQLPLSQFGYFLNSPVQNLTGFIPPGSQGRLCIGPASIGRYNLPSQIYNTGASGEGSLILDLTATPIPTPPFTTSIQPGETWYFTSWYRDSNPNPTSNFTDGVCITFQ